jgi:hypothetical protein
MRRTALGLACACAVLSWGQACADSVTYDFSGYILSADGSTYAGAGITPGIAITGTYTFDVANPQAQLIGAPVGSQTSDWALTTAQGTSSVLFATTAQFGSLSYSSSSSTSGSISGTYNGSSDKSQIYTAGESGITTNSTMSIEACYNGCGGGLPLGLPAYMSNGLPVPFSDSSEYYLTINAQGTLANPTNVDYLAYRITALQPASSPVPLPFSVWLMLSGIGTLGLFARRRLG